MKPLQGIFFRDWENDHVIDIFKEIFFEKLYDHIIKKGDVVVDVGANQGFFTWWAHLKGALKIYSVEPSAMHVEALKKMIEFNKINAEVIPAALSDKDGEMTFYHNDNTTMFMLQKTDEKAQSETVKTMTIGTLLKDIPHIHLLKVDIEGAENTCFANSTFDLVAPKIDNIILEYHSWSGISVTLLMNTIRDRGFTVTQLQTQATVLWFQKK